MTPTIKGSGDIIEKPYEVFYDPRRGLSVRRKYTAAGGDTPLLGVEADAQANGYTTRKLVSPVLSELEIVSPETEPGGGSTLTVTDQWQLLGNEITKSIYECPAALAAEEFHPGTIARIKAAVAANSTTITLPYSDVYADDAIILGGLATKEQDTFLRAQYVLRHTTNCSPSYADNVSDDNVFRVYTKTQLLSECQSTSLWAQPLAGHLVNKINNITDLDARTNYLWGWLKKPATEQTTADNRIEITQEYWLEQWPLILYPQAL